MEILHKNGLRPLPFDERDLKLGNVFDMGSVEDLPEGNFIVGSILIKDQRGTDFCTGYSVSSVSASQEGEDLSPEFQFGVTKDLSGDDEWGADLRMACQSAVKVGSIPQKIWDSVFGEDSHYNREIVINRKAYPKEWDELASVYKKKTFWAVTGPGDHFDNIRLALWKNKDEHCEVVTGAMWRQSWTRAIGGIIKKAGSEEGSGHAFCIVGQKIIEGQPFLVARLSNGKNYGNDGLFYFSRGVVNKELARFGFFMFKDMEKETARVLNDSKTQETPTTKRIAQLIALIKKIWIAMKS